MSMPVLERSFPSITRSPKITKTARSKLGRVSSFPRKYSHAGARKDLQHQRRERAFLGRRHAAVHRASERGPEGSRTSLQLALHRFARCRFPSKFTERRHLSLSWSQGKAAAVV